MKKIFLLIFVFTITVFITGSSKTNIKENKNFSSEEFFVKTKTILPVSEATGKISLQTGLSSLDDIIRKYRVTGISKVFNLDNGNKNIYDKLGMERIYSFSLNNDAGYSDDEELKDAVKEFNKNDIKNDIKK